MATIVVEQRFDFPGSIDDVRQIMQATERCRGLNSVVALSHYLSADGRRLIGLFDAPDAEAVRRAMRSGYASQPQSIWAATTYATQESAGARPSADRSRSLVVVERSYAVPTPFEQVLPSKEILRLCFELRAVNHVASYVAHDQMRIVCIDEAPDAETVRTANRHAGMHFDVAWHAADIMEYAPGAPDLVN
jgi:hypothetical protein